MSLTATEENMNAVMARYLKMLEDPSVKAANRPARELRMKILLGAADLAQLQADAGYRSVDNALAVARTVTDLETKWKERKAIDEGKRTLRIFLFMFAALWAKSFVETGAPIYLAGALLVGHLWARWRI